MIKVDGKGLLLCSCEGTMALNGKEIASTLAGAEGETYSHLCRAQLGKFDAALKSGDPLVIACTQEAPLFAELVEEAGREDIPTFVNIRERAGWSREGAKATPKMAALIAAAMVPDKVTPAMTMASDGRVLVVGPADPALALAEDLSEDLPVTCLLTAGGDEPVLSAGAFPLYRGRVARLSGVLGRFSIEFADLAAYQPSARGAMTWLPAGQPGPMEYDLVLDVTGGVPLAPGADLRDGYVKVDPGDALGQQKALRKLISLVGEFEKPHYVDVAEKLCAHQRSGITGCTRCLDACPSGAIVSAGDHVKIDPFICMGHGACAAACPTGALRFDYPATQTLHGRLRRLLATFTRAGGENPVLLLHDDKQGDQAIALMARLGPGLPAHVLPFAVENVSAIGPDLLTNVLAYGASAVAVLAPDPTADLAPLRAGLRLADAVMDGLGYGGGRITIIDDPDPMAAADTLFALERQEAVPAATHSVMGRKRDAMRQALDHLHAQAPHPVAEIALDADQPFGQVIVDGEACTLCLSCVGACPAGALADGKDLPQLRFQEGACVQCGLCRATCPEKAISLKPRMLFLEEARQFQVLKEEPPFECVVCGKPYATRSAIERVKEKLSANPMFAGGDRMKLLEMCDDCRVVAQMDQPQPLAGEARPRPRTTDDYLAGRIKDDD